MHDQGAAARVERLVAGNPSATALKAFAHQSPPARAYLVGGGVRDAILGRKTDDLDFLVCGAARPLLESWLSARGRVELVGARFGVLKFTPNGLATRTVDVALPRRERPTPDSRGGYRDFDAQVDPDLPLEVDLARRDFTLNAMAYDLETRVLIDPFDGRADLEARSIRAVGDPLVRFSEDLTRLLRAVRFAVQLAFTVEERTWEALRALAPRLTLDADAVVARETVGEELAKAVAADPVRAFALLEASGIRAAVLPLGLSPLPPTLNNADATVSWAIALRHLSPSNAKKALRDAGLTAVAADAARRPKEEEITWMLTQLADTTAIAHLSEREIEKRFMDDRGKRYVKFRLALGEEGYVHEAQERIDRIREKTGVRFGEIPSLISGTDVLEHGVLPGPGVRELLEDVRERQLKGELKTKSQAIAYLAKATKE